MTLHPPTGEPGLEAPESITVQISEGPRLLQGYPAYAFDTKACSGGGIEYVRAATPSPVALPDDVAGDVVWLKAVVAENVPYEGKRFFDAARRLAAHVQSQSSTIGGLEGEVERLRGHARGMALSLEAVGFGDGGKLCTPLGRYRDEYPPSSPAHLPRTALKPVARGEKDAAH